MHPVAEAPGAAGCVQRFCTQHQAPHGEEQLIVPDRRVAFHRSQKGPQQEALTFPHELEAEAPGLPGLSGHAMQY